MSKGRHVIIAAVTLAAIVVAGTAFGAGKVRAVYPLAILPFQERGSGVKDYGQKVADILFAKLATNHNLILVDRADLDKLLKEHRLSLSGMVRPDEAVKVGQLTGAKILVTGSVIEVDRTLYLIAKIIGTETSRVVGESVKGRTRDPLGPLAERLAAQVAATVVKRSGQLVAKSVKMEDRIKALAKALGAARRPSVMVKIAERHVGRVTIDPAAETEVILFCRGTGFEVFDSTKGAAARADILITGEGFSEFGGRRGELISVKARVEIKAVDRATGKIVAIDRQTAIAVDLTERIAGKTALQQAAADIAERLLPKLVKR